MCTDDGSTAGAGFVTDALTDLVAERSIDVVYAAGPVPMMRAVAEVTEPLGVRTIVSLNPIMVDGTGMCGGCRVTVDGTMRFACVDGPEFDGHGVDFAELADRLGTYRESELDCVQPCLPGDRRMTGIVGEPPLEARTSGDRSPDDADPRPRGARSGTF